jgi:hypothetical protein
MLVMVLEMVLLFMKLKIVEILRGFLIIEMNSLDCPNNYIGLTGRAFIFRYNTYMQCKPSYSGTTCICSVSLHIQIQHVYAV